MHIEPIKGAYTLFMILAGITVIAGSLLYSLKRGLPFKQILYCLLIMFVSALIGARLLNVLINFSVYATEPAKIFVFNTTGFSLYGGIIFAVISGIISAKTFRINIWKFGDTVIPFVGIGIALMRIGCFLNGCCFGKETNLPWGVIYPNSSISGIYHITENPFSFTREIAVHPTQIYEMTAALIGAFVAFYLIRKKTTHGAAFFAFALWFTAFRWFNLNFRESPGTFSEINYFYPLLYFSIIMIVLFFSPFISPFKKLSKTT